MKLFTGAKTSITAGQISLPQNFTAWDSEAWIG
jgi:hypothetical protein